MAHIDIPTGPIETTPDGETREPTWPGELLDAKRDALTQALDGLELGSYDREVADWLAYWEPATVATICSWLHRIRALNGDPR